VDELRLLAAAGEVERCRIAMPGDGRSDDQTLKRSTRSATRSTSRTPSAALPPSRSPRGRRRQCQQRRRRPRRGAPALLLPVHVSVTPFRSRPKLDKNLNDDDVAAGVVLLSKSQSFAAVTARSSVAREKKGIWG